MARITLNIYDAYSPTRAPVPFSPIIQIKWTATCTYTCLGDVHNTPVDVVFSKLTHTPQANHAHTSVSGVRKLSTSPYSLAVRRCGAPSTSPTCGLRSATNESFVIFSAPPFCSDVSPSNEKTHTVQNGGLSSHRGGGQVSAAHLRRQDVSRISSFRVFWDFVGAFDADLCVCVCVRQGVS